MLVRQATPHDVDGFTAAFAQVAEEGRWIATEPPIFVDALTDRVREMMAEGATLFVLDDGGRIVGTAAVHLTRADGVVAIGMSVVAEHRGHGGGRALLEAVIEHARGMRCHKIELEVWPDNKRAIALYEKFGFEVEGLRRDHYRRRDGSLRSALLMALLL